MKAVGKSPDTSLSEIEAFMVEIAPFLSEKNSDLLSAFLHRMQESYGDGVVYSFQLMLYRYFKLHTEPTDSHVSPSNLAPLNNIVEAVCSSLSASSERKENASFKSSYEEGSYIQEGEYWAIKYKGPVFRLLDSKGLRYISWLIRHPYREFHVMDLVNLTDGTGQIEVATQPYSKVDGRFDSNLTISNNSDLGDVIDPTALREYRIRLGLLNEEIKEAETAGSIRARELVAERVFIMKELSKATGLGGRIRKEKASSERARLNVTRAIKSAISRIERHDRSLASHFLCIRTGTFCSYRPRSIDQLDWKF